MNGELLLIDDVPENLQALGDLLRGHGFTIREAPGSERARRSIRARLPDAILLDVRMPGMDGFALCRELRSDPSLRHTPILFLSASEDASDRVAAFAAGGQDFIAKPFVPAEVLARVEAHLSLARLRREAEERVADGEARLALILAAAGVGVWEAIGGTVAFDAAAAAMLGLPTGTRLPWRELLAGLGLDDAPLGTAGGMVEGEGWWGEPGPARRRLRLRGRPTGPAGTLAGVVWDITDEHRLRERLSRQDRLESLGRLAGGLAHDLNNQLTVIDCELDMLAIEAPSEEVFRRLASISAAVESSSGLIRDLLAFAGRREVQRRPTELGVVVRQAVRMASHSLGGTVRPVLSACERELWVSGDPGLLANALLNLCLNARDAMPGGGDIEVGLRREMVTDRHCAICHGTFSGDWAVLAIADRGDGIPDDVLPHLFEPFFTTKQDGKGLGLGLHSVLHCVRTHGGHLCIDSAPGRGATFSIHLPPVEPPVSGSSSIRRHRLRRGRLLVVDDQRSVREAITEGLAALGWQAVACPAAEEADGLWRSAEPAFDAALVDLAMPGIDGVTLFRTLRQTDPRARVLLMSGHAGGIDLTALAAEGLAGFITKPVKLRPLAERLSGLLEDASS